MKVSYIKTQWFYVVLSVVYAALAIANMVRGDDLMSVCWTVSAIVMLLLSLIGHLAERSRLLEKKSEKYDALCELVQELVEANRIARELDKVQDAKIKKLEEKLK